MLEKPSISDQRIIACLSCDYSIKVIALTFLPLGADMMASVYKAEAEDGVSYFVKLKRGHHHELSLTIIELLQKAGLEQLIPPVKTSLGQPSQRIDDFTLLVYPFIEGQNGFSRPLTDEQWLILGKALRQVHGIKVPTPIQHQLRQEAYSPKWREIVRLLYTPIEAEPIEDELAVKLLTFMKAKAAIIHQLVDRAEKLAKKLQEEAPKFVLCHSDIHGGNVLIDRKNTIYLIDWDDPIMAPKERDLMFIGGGVGNVWNKPREEELFYKGYGHTEVNKAILAYYRHERIVEDIALYGQDLLLTTAGNENRHEMYKHFLAMFEPRGVVDLALNTDDGLVP